MSDSPQPVHVIGSGPNGLAAAIAVARAGRPVTVYEAEAQPGGSVRTMELTLPGFHHDFGAAVFPMALSSPFFSSLHLEHHGLEWIHGSAPLAHPFDDGSALVLERDLGDAHRRLAEDGPAWRALFEPLVSHWLEFASDILGSPLRFPRHPLRMARFASQGLQPALTVACHRFSNPRTRALFAGLAAHSSLSLDQPLSSAVAMVLGAAAHAVGWPIPRTGSQSVTNALLCCLEQAGGRLETNRHVLSLDELGPAGSTILCDVTPRQLQKLASSRLRGAYNHSLGRYRYGPGAFKIDYALSQPIPWRAPESARAITVHVGGSIESIARSEHAAAHGEVPDEPFLIVVQPTLFDSTRTPHGKHTAWVYCHVPNGSKIDMTARIEDQLERFAPGFRDCVLARHTLSPSELESMNANLIGGDINGGEFSLRQFFFRPTWRTYSTGAPGLHLCSSSTPPGGGVHGMCGYHAAQQALHHA